MFEFPSADDGINVWNIFLDLRAVAFYEAAGHDELLRSSGSLMLCHLKNCVDGFLLCRIDERTRIHNDDVGFIDASGDLGSSLIQKPHHDFAVDQVLRTAKADEPYLLDSS